MSQNITFLSGKNRLVKTFKKDGTKAFPLAAKFLSSESHTVDWDNFEGKVQLLRKAAKQGKCLLKGQLKREIKNESRAGLTDRVAMTRTLILDFDGIEIDELPEAPLTQPKLQAAAEKLIQKLPEDFRNCSYIAHASSSMGVKQGIASMHLEFILDAPVSPKMLKQFLYFLNFECVEVQLRLNPSGFSLKWIIDPALADNTRLIYIAHPNFEDGVANPIPKNEDRIFCVLKDNNTLPAQKLIDQVNVPELDQQRKDLINALRKKVGLRKMEMKTSYLKIDGRDVEVNNRPEALQMTFAYENGPFVYYNVNGGDSNAYYVKKSNPDVVFNFKGEEPFLFAIADKEMHQWHKEQFPPVDQTGKALRIPVCWRDREADTHYTAFFDPGEQRLLELASNVSASSIPDFFRDFGYEAPEIMPQFMCGFRPDYEVLFDAEKRWANTFQPTDVMFNPPEVDKKYLGLSHNTLYSELDEACPMTFKLLTHIFGGKDEEVARFLNWLGFTVQLRRKAGTAWVIHGTQGTGKGLLFEKVLAPIFGRYARKINPKNLFDLSNTWHSESLIVFVDENKEKRGKDADEEYNLIKNYITEESGTVRAMHSNQKIGHFFANFIFTSNELDAIRIPDNDRRFNVGTRQETALIKAHPEFEDQENIEKLGEEATYLYTILANMIVDEKAARQPIENKAKKVMKLNTKSTIEEFVSSIQRGNFDFFSDVLTAKPVTAKDFEVFSSARKTMLDAVQHMCDRSEHRIDLNELLILYLASTSDKSTTVRKFTKMLRLNGLDPQKIRINNIIIRGVQVKWHSLLNKPEDLKKIFLSDAPIIGVTNG